MSDGRKRRRRAATAGALALLTAGTAAAQTGRLLAEVRDEQELPLAGVSVVARSPVMMGRARRSQTGRGGRVLLPALAPGLYELELRKDGHASVVRSEVPVRLDRTTALRITLPRAGAGEVLMTSGAPVIEARLPSPPTSFTAEDLERTAVGADQRAVTSILPRVPGIARTAAGVRLLGSTEAENVLLVDGLDATDPATGLFGARVPFDAVAELAVHPAGLGVELGRATGGVVSVLTKSGGDELTLTVDARYRATDFTESGDHFDPERHENRQAVVAATAGGAVVRSRLWYFLALESADAERTVPGSATPVAIDAEASLAKLAWQAREDLQLRALWSSDPIDASGDRRQTSDIRHRTSDIGRQPERTGAGEPTVRSRDGDLFQLAATGVSEGGAAWELQAERHDLRTRISPPGGGVAARSIDLRPELLAAAGISEAAGDASRDELRARLELPLWGAGVHRAAVGLEVSDLSLRDPSPADLRVEGGGAGLWAQDTTRPGSRWTLAAGLRYDLARFDGASGEEVAELERLQPRLGIAWDPAGRGRAVVRLAAGRAMHPASLALPAFVTTGGEAENRIAPGLDPMVADELVVGFERRLAPRTSLRLEYARKKTEDILEDTCAGNLPQPSAVAECSFTVMANLEGLRRDYEGASLLVDSRPTRRLWVRFFYLWSRSEGSVETALGRGEAFDVFPWHFVNRFGFLSDDRRHRLRLSGFVLLPADVTVGFDGSWTDRFPFDVVADCDVAASGLCGAPYGVTFIEPRGSRRAATGSTIDLQMTKGIALGERRIELVLAVSNLLDREEPVGVCEDVEGCGAALLGDALDWRLPRAWEAGVRLEW